MSEEMIKHWKTLAERECKEVARLKALLEARDAKQLVDFKKECMNALHRSRLHGKTIPEMINDLWEEKTGMEQALHHLRRLYAKLTPMPWRIEIVTGVEKSPIQLGVLDALARLEELENGR